MLAFLAAVLATTPVLSLGAPDAGGCARTVVLGTRTLAGGPREFCIEQLLQVSLAEGDFLVLRVAAPHRFDARVRSRVFVYRVEGLRLVPRFLGSGFASREVLRLFALDQALGLETLTHTGERETLSCAFVGFPLVCSELNP